MGSGGGEEEGEGGGSGDVVVGIGWVGFQDGPRLVHTLKLSF